MWQNYFVMGWQATGNVLAAFLGGTVAVVLFFLVMCLVLLALVAVLAILFDAITAAMAKRWEKVGRRPANRWAEIIARGSAVKNDRKQKEQDARKK